MKTLTVVACCVGLRLSAQTPKPATSPGIGETAVGSIRDLWKTSIGYVLAAAEQMPESSYAFKPTPDVRSFGQVVAHVANGQRLLCAMALGQEPAETKPTSKAEIVAALEESSRLCTRAYSIADAQALEPLSAVARAAWVSNGFGTPRTRLYALMMNAWHDNEHYGNLVTYMRLRGMVPPSSQPK